MTLAWLQRLRLFVPGVILFVFLYPIARSWFPGWGVDLADPAAFDPREGLYLLACVGLGAVYSATPLRHWSNARYFDQVNGNLVGKLVGSFVADPDIMKKRDSFSWPLIRPIFYHYLDHDETLKQKTKIAYWNSLLWSSIADLRGISCIFIVVYVLASVFADDIGYVGWTVGAGVSFLMSVPLSMVVTRRYMGIGDEQIEYMIAHYAPEIREKLQEAAAKL